MCCSAFECVHYCVEFCFALGRDFTRPYILSYWFVVNTTSSNVEGSATVSEPSSPSSLSEFTGTTPSYSPVSDESFDLRFDQAQELAERQLETNGNSLQVEVHCEVHSIGERHSWDKNVENQLLSVASTSRMARTKQTTKKSSGSGKEVAWFSSSSSDGGTGSGSGDDGNVQNPGGEAGAGVGLGKGCKRLLAKVPNRIAKPRHRRSRNKLCCMHKDKPQNAQGRCYHYKLGTCALLEIAYYQKRWGLILSKAAFARLVREVADDVEVGLRWLSSAILALQEGTEAYIVGLHEDIVLEAIHGRRVTIMPKDMHIAQRIRGDIEKGLGVFQPSSKKKESKNLPKGVKPNEY